MDYGDVEDKVLGKGARGSKRSRGGGSERSSPGGGSGPGREVQLSKALSRLLRHQAEKSGIKLDSEGFAPLDLVVSTSPCRCLRSLTSQLTSCQLQWGPIRGLNPSFEEIQSAVSDNAKQRFSLKPNPETNPDLDTSSTEPKAWLIRANQGHSIKLDSEGLLNPITAENLPAMVVHGTYFAFWPSIVASGGLKRMSRNHVHCSAGDPGQDPTVISGMRHDAELMVYIDVEASMKEGMKWWLSDNGVVLTEGDEEGCVPAKFFKEVVGRKMDVGVLWSEGEKVADLPPHIKGIVPRGKERHAGSGRGRGGRPR
jgi:2'-phosphotransferase